MRKVYDGNNWTPCDTLDVAVSLLTQVIMLPLIGTEQGLGNLWFFAPLAFGAIGIGLALSSKWSGRKDVRLDRGAKSLGASVRTDVCNFRIYRRGHFLCDVARYADTGRGR